ncbi:MAG: hypothetical protein HKM98_01230 [Gammaproteobacteria bacterium]|nr:hypothetical protein [Gammaproteobacteria bacterium]
MSTRTRMVSYRSTTRNGVLTEAVVIDTRRRGFMAWVWTGWLAAFLAALALNLYSIMAPFVPSVHWLELIKLPAGLVAIALPIPVLFFTPKLRFERTRDRIGWQVTRILCVPVMAYLMWQGLLIGAPAVGHHLASSTESVQTFSVKAKASHYDRYSLKLGRCAGKVYLVSDLRFLNLRSCGVPESDWRRVEAGDQIELHGNASWFGLKYTALRALW